MKRIYSVLVENRSGVLCKVAGLFSRRCFNIDSLAVGETDAPDTSVMTIVSSGDERTIEQIEKQLNKKLDVIKVKTFSESQSISRELMLIKVKYNKGNRREILETCDESEHYRPLQKYNDDTDLRRAGESETVHQHVSFGEYCGDGAYRNSGAAEMYGVGCMIC